MGLSAVMDQIDDMQLQDLKRLWLGIDEGQRILLCAIAHEYRVTCDALAAASCEQIEKHFEIKWGVA